MARAALAIVGGMVLLGGCTAHRSASPTPGARVDPRAPVAVLPFRTGGSLSPAGELLPGGEEPSAADGDVAAAARQLSTHLAALGVAVRDPDAVAGAAQLADRGRYDPALARRVGVRTDAGLAILGTLVRYHQREGTAWAARSPASVEYQVALVRVTDGAVLLIDRFAYTQEALTENLLQLPRVLRGGARWLTREEILDGALRETAEKMATVLGLGRAARPEGAGR
jgi:hypothetical protein